MLRITDRGWMFMKRWTLRFLVFTIIAFAQLGYWFLTMNQNEFPTGEVQYAVMPALLHPYLFPWEAPYGVIWYAIQYGLVAFTFLPVGAYLFLSGAACPNNCMAVIHYINGTSVTIPFEAGMAQWIMGLSWMVSLALWNIPFYWMFRKSQMLVAYWMSSLFLWATVPVNVSVLWIVALGYKRWYFLPLALLTKFPFLAPLAVWKFALGSGSTIGHWFPYLLLGFWFTAITVHLLDKHRHQGRALWLPWLALNGRMVGEYEPEDRYLARWLEHHYKGPQWRFEPL
jgi:hypothetical protein